MPGKKAFLFPGQGSQYVGMGRDMFDEFDEAKEIFEQVDEICQRPISRLCFEGPLEELTLTVNLQPAVTAVNLVCLSAVKNSGISADISAGHSLGEYAALHSAGVITGYDALRLVQKRGELMHRESLENPGMMTAVLGLEIDAIADIVDRAAGKGVVAVANHNTARQIVITGEAEALNHAADLIRDKRGKAVPLKVSGAWHCSLMKNAVEDFRAFMKEIAFSSPGGGILFNSTAGTEDDPEAIKRIMADQLISPVRWYDIICEMLNNGVDTFVEIGPKRVLSGLLQKIIPEDSGAGVYNVEDLKGLASLLEGVK